MDYTQIIIGLITLFIGVIDCFLIPWLKEKYDNAKFERFLKYVKIAVQAAEQIIDKSEYEAKKQYVIQFLNGRGIKFDEAVVDAAIESAVIEMKNELLK